MTFQQLGNPMKFIHLQACVFVLFFCTIVSLSSAQAQTQGHSAYEGKRQQAMQLFEQGKRLEALPLLEELVQKDPRDDEMLVALAASLVDHAATLTEPDAAAKERFRARDLLQRAWQLGNTSPLEENLRQLLRELPANGTIEF